MKTTCSKRWPSVPFAHRAPLHDGHCRLIHGHNWVIEATFEALRLDGNGFVVDFGKLREFKQWVDENFDHALVLSENDPALAQLKICLKDFAEIRVVQNCSCEGLALTFFNVLDAIVQRISDGRAHVHSLTLFEDEKNSATVTNPKDWNRA